MRLGGNWAADNAGFQPAKEVLGMGSQARSVSSGAKSSSTPKSGICHLPSIIQPVPALRAEAVKAMHEGLEELLMPRPNLGDGDYQSDDQIYRDLDVDDLHEHLPRRHAPGKSRRSNDFNDQFGSCRESGARGGGGRPGERGRPGSRGGRPGSRGRPGSSGNGYAAPQASQAHAPHIRAAPPMRLLQDLTYG